jgi:arylsulfatase A-like enzyme
MIMGDDIGMWNIGAYHRGMMAGTTPHIDKLAAEGAIFTDLLRRGELHGRPGQLHHR